jgi:rhodanese-related sulfurtransferase
MPIYSRPDGLPVVAFEPDAEISPFTLFKRLRKGQEILLVDVRSARGEHRLKGSLRWPGEAWEPPSDREVVLYDAIGEEAVHIARAYQKRGHPRVKALFGGLDLWIFALDPAVVGEETYLVADGPEDQPASEPE